ncbi:hypothetical protein HQ447_12955, partial [bacterium]|nr:hypothetical protein [bacterium]
VQAATDYGLIGASLLVLLLGRLVVLVVVRMLFSETPRESGNTDAWRVGGLAALAGMFVQSNFSFVFHLMPGAILLGLCLGQVAGPPGIRVGKPHLIGSGILLTATALGCLLLLLPLGWSGTRVTQLLWPSYFSKSPPASEAKIDALDAAIPLWPQPSLYLDRGLALQAAVLAGGPDSTADAERAIRDFETTEALHPLDPTPVFNRAHLLSDFKKDAEAEAAYSRAIQLQGGMEPAFRGHFSFARHLLRKGLRQFRRDDPAPSLATLELAAREMETAVAEMHWVIADMQAPRLSIHETLGAAREANGDYPGAMQAYDFAAKLPNGSRAHYRAGVLNEKLAAAAWSSRRPAEAMGYFIEAKKRIGQARELPKEVTASQRIEFVAYLDRSIEFLKGAKIEPALPAAIPPP